MHISCAALILILLLTACGKGNAPSGGTGSADGAAQTPSSASVGEETETESAPETPSAEAGGVIYDENDIQITLTGFTQRRDILSWTLILPTRVAGRSIWTCIRS